MQREAHPGALSHHGGIRSFVIRETRISEAQRRAWTELMPRYEIPFRPGEVCVHDYCRADTELVVEIGFGMGEATAAIARQFPQTDFVAIDVHRPGIGSLLLRLEREGLDNVRVIRGDAVDVLSGMVRQESLAGVHLFFPDPWPKKRHHKRRFLNPAGAELLGRVLRPGGYCYAVTDWEDYALQMRAVIAAEPGLEVGEAGVHRLRAWRPETAFERKGRAAGRAIEEIIAVKRGEE